MNGRLTYVVLDGATQEDMLTLCLCYHMHRKLIFNWRLIHPLKYTYSQHNISANIKCLLQMPQ